MKFFEQIRCEFGWIDSLGFAHCNIGSAIGEYCTKEDCFLYEEN